MLRLLFTLLIIAVATCSPAGCALRCPDGSKIASGVDEAAVRAKYGEPDAITERGGEKWRIYPGDEPPQNCRPMELTLWHYLERGATFRFEMGRLADVFPLGGNNRSLTERMIELKKERQQPQASELGPAVAPPQ